MKKINILMVLIIIMFPSFVFSETLTLDESIDIALKNNKNLKLAEQELRKAKGQITEAWGGATPEITLTGGFQYKDDVEKMVIPNFMDPGGEPMEFKMGEKDNYFANITINQPIWVGGKIGAALKGAKLYSKYAEHNFQNVKQMVIYGTKIAFYGVLLSRESVSVSEESLELSEKHLERVKKYYEQGLSSRFDLLRAEVAVANTKPTVIEARNGLELSLNQFKNTIGYELTRQVDLEGKLEYKKYDIDFQAALELAFNNREDWKSMRFQILGQEQMVKITKGNFYPSLVLTGKYDGYYNENSQDADNWDESLSATLSLNWSLDYFGYKGKLDQEHVKYSQIQTQKLQLKDQIELEVKQALLNLEEAKNIIESQTKTVEQAEESYEIAEVRYENGTGTELEVSDARLNLNVAKMNYLKALFDYCVAKTTVDKVTGTLSKNVQ